MFIETSNLKARNSVLFDEFNGRVNSERFRLEDGQLSQLNPNSLSWNGVDPVEVYFINEGAGYRNQLFLSVNDGPLQMLFEDIASPDSILKNGDGPLALGDGGNLGSYEGPTQLEFLIKANGKNGGNNIYGADPLQNPDGLEHVLAYEYTDGATGDNWVLLGFEDLFGPHYGDGGNSDRDFNDVVFAVKGVQGEPAKTPESSALLGLLTLGAVVSVSRRLQMT